MAFSRNGDRVIYTNMVGQNVMDRNTPMTPVVPTSQVHSVPSLPGSPDNSTHVIQTLTPQQMDARSSAKSNASQLSAWDISEAEADLEPFDARKVLRNEDRLMYVMTDMLHPMVVNGLVFLEGPMAMSLLKEMAAWLLAEHPVLASVVKDGVWVPHKELNMHEHITITEVEAERDMEEFISQVVSSDVSMVLPMWHLHMANQASTGQHVLVVRVHHCIGDGVALMTLLDKLLKRDEPSEKETLLRRRKAPLYIKCLRVFCIMLLAPLVMLQLLFMRRDPKTCFQCKTTSAGKTVTWLNPMSLEEINQVGKKVRGTVNDVLLSLTAGALSRYLEIVQGKPFRRDLKCIVPFSVRSWPERFDLNNRVSAIFIHLPVACNDPVKRMRQTKKRMDKMKSGAWVSVTVMLSRITTQTMNTRLCKWLQYLYSSKCTLIFSNVRSANTEAELMGLKVKSVMGFVPLPGDLGLGVTLVSYNGQILLGIVANPQALERPSLLAEQYSIEFNEMKTALGINASDDAEAAEASVSVSCEPTAVQQADVEVTFKVCTTGPDWGLLGLTFNDASGEVDEVKDVGQAKKWGVQVGWRIARLDDAPYSRGLVLQKHSTGQKTGVPYSITFSKQKQAAGTSICDRVEPETEPLAVEEF